MTINDYQRLAMRTANKGRDLANGGLGLAGEAGECVDIIKKHLFHEHPLDKEALALELGDVCWYVALIATLIGKDLETIMHGNIEKLMERYPKGFSAERSLNRLENRTADEEAFIDKHNVYMSKTEAAKIIGVTRATIYAMLKDGRLRHSGQSNLVDTRSVFGYLVWKGVL